MRVFGPRSSVNWFSMLRIQSEVVRVCETHTHGLSSVAATTHYQVAPNHSSVDSTYIAAEPLPPTCIQHHHAEKRTGKDGAKRRLRKDALL